MFKVILSIKTLILPVVAIALFSVSCRGQRKNKNEVVVYTSVDQVFSQPILRIFEKKSGIKVRIVFDTEETKSTGILNRLLAESKNPQADVFWSGDPVRPQLLVRRGLTENYLPLTAKDIPSRFKDSAGSWVGFSARARVLLINTNKVPKGEYPKSIMDLINPRWKGKVAIANPAFGTTTMHLAALFASWGSKKGARFLDELRKNSVRIATSNGEVKRLVVTGEVDWGLTDTDDAAVAIKSGAPVKMIFPDQTGEGALLIPTTAVLMRKAPHQSNGKKLMEFLTSREVERLLAYAACAQLPLRQGVKIPPTVFKIQSLKIMSIDYARLAIVMEKIHPYLRDWVEGRQKNPPLIKSSKPGAKPPISP
jgi:iron(III) transport system substrate-binding protein